MKVDARRLFIALWPTDELRRNIEEETSRAAHASGGRVIPSANFHITLAFLGPVPEARVVELVGCVARSSIVPFELILSRVSWWENPGLLCLEPSSGARVLTALVDRLRENLRSQNFMVEARPYRPHLTLARDVRKDLAANVVGQTTSELRWHVRRMELVASQPSALGSSYTVLPT